MYIYCIGGNFQGRKKHDNFVDCVPLSKDSRHTINGFGDARHTVPHNVKQNRNSTPIIIVYTWNELLRSI